MTAEEKREELNRLRRLLAVRDGKSGYIKNVAAIKTRIAELDAAK